MNTKTKKGLGKGLEALLGTNRGVLEKAPAAQHNPNTVSGASQGSASSAAIDSRVSSDTNLSGGHLERLIELDISALQPGKYQPRRVIDNESLEELATSIKQQGVMQPIVVRSVPADVTVESKSLVRYEIIAGERRWRAVQLAGLTKIPAIIKDVSDEAAIAMALIENLQRDNLNPMDEAYALYRLQQEFELTHQEVAEAVGKSRAAVSNALRLMNLHKDVKLLLENGDIEMGHARALLALDDVSQTAAAIETVEKRLSVRQTEALVKNLQNPAAKKSVEEAPLADDANIRTLQNELSEKLGAAVSIQHKASGKGKLVFSYNSLDELDGILGHIR